MQNVKNIPLKISRVSEISGSALQNQASKSPVYLIYKFLEKFAVENGRKLSLAAWKTFEKLEKSVVENGRLAEILLLWGFCGCVGRGCSPLVRWLWSAVPVCRGRWRAGCGWLVVGCGALCCFLFSMAFVPVCKARLAALSVQGPGPCFLLRSRCENYRASALQNFKISGVSALKIASILRSFCLFFACVA